MEGLPVYSLRPSWRVESLEMRNRFGWHVLSGDKLREIREKLGFLESMTWADLLVGAKKQHHSVDISRIIPEARRRLEERRLLLEKVVSLRLSGEERVWGYLAENGVLVLLWWDPCHEICPSALKHT